MKKRNKFKRIDILKSSGAYEHFSPQKLHNSLRLTGLSRDRANVIVEDVVKKIAPGDSTKDIFRHAYRLVRKESPIAAVHYSLKKALQGLGPTGYVFENYTAKFFQETGYKTKLDVTLRGRYVTHEIDVVASNGQEKFFVECKFHNNAGHKNDVKVALYVKARWDDLHEGPDGRDLSGYYLVTNTAFTQDAISYAEGTGLHLLGVNAPRDHSFIEQIRAYKLYPITSLARLKKHVREQLIDRDIILCRELLVNRALLLKFGMDDAQIDLLYQDINNLLASEEYQ